MQPSISIIIPMYNAEKYIIRCLSSVVVQTYTQQLECICIDDGSTDKSYEVTQNFINEHPLPIHFHLLHHSRNMGQSVARNTGIEQASGQYVFFMDSDDELPINAMKLFVDTIKKYDNIDMVQGRIISLPANQYYDISRYKNNEFIQNNRIIRALYYQTIDELPAHCANRLIKRSFIMQHGLLFHEGLLHEDEHWMFYVVKYLQSMAFVFDPTYIRYYNEGSIMMTMNAEKEGVSWGTIILDWIEHCDEPLSIEQLRKIMHQYNRWQVYNYIQFKENIQLIKKISIKILHHRRLKSLFLFYLWLSIKPIKNIKKILRFSYQAL